jgi:hypothetical protein
MQEIQRRNTHGLLLMERMEHSQISKLHNYNERATELLSGTAEKLEGQGSGDRDQPQRRSNMGFHGSTADAHKSGLRNQNMGCQASSSWESRVSAEPAFTVKSYSFNDVMNMANGMVARRLARSIHSDPDSSIVLATIVVTHEAKPRFVPARAKYDTGSDANFVPHALVKESGLLEFMVKLEAGTSEENTEAGVPKRNVSIGLDNQEHIIHHTITLQWSAATMWKARTTQFHVAEDLPYDMVLGNPFIQENGVFDSQRVALPVRRKYPCAGKFLHAKMHWKSF